MPTFPVPQTIEERVEWAALRILEVAGSLPTAREIAEALVDDDVSRGEYEGCSTELEGWFSDYENAANRVLEGSKS